jgi:hypothetical protein
MSLKRSQQLKFVLFSGWLALFLSQNIFDVIALARFKQPFNHPELPFVCAIAQCSTFFDSSLWLIKKSSATLSFADGARVEVPFMEVVDQVHRNYFRYVTFLKLPMFAETSAGENFLKEYYCRPADFVRSYLPTPQAKPARVDWLYLSWDEKVRIERSVSCDRP